MYGEINALIERGIEDGTLVSLPVSVVALLLVAPAMQLARNAVLTDRPPSPDTVAQTFGQVWRSIAADPLAQLHRWYQYYEHREVGIDNQLALLTENVSVVAPSGAVEDRDSYAKVVEQIPPNWQNSHELQNASVTVNSDNSVSLTATITYRNIGMLPDEAIQTRSVLYEAQLEHTDSALPVFSRVEIASGAPMESDGFRDLYPENRLKSLVHYWMALVEHPDRAANPFKEILAPEIHIDFGNGQPITSFEHLEDWVNGPASSVQASRHQIDNFNFTELAMDHYELQFDASWHGIRLDGVVMSAKTQHTWSVLDTPSDRFAQIEAIQVEVLEPFKVVSD